MTPFSLSRSGSLFISSMPEIFQKSFKNYIFEENMIYDVVSRSATKPSAPDGII
jgi:hypothetical protein